MESVTITIRTGNESFQPEPSREVARILRHLADRIDEQDERDWPEHAIDFNGNRVGEITTT